MSYPVAEGEVYNQEHDLTERSHVVVCLGGLSVHNNGSPIFMCKAYGPFTAEEVEEKAKGIQRLEGGAVCIRPLVDLNDTYRRISAD